MLKTLYCAKIKNNRPREMRSAARAQALRSVSTMVRIMAQYGEAVAENDGRSMVGRFVRNTR